MGVEMLTGRLYRLLLGPFQAYLWRDPDSLTLIDTGPVDAGVAIAGALDELGLAPSDLDRVVLTHYHDDHVGAAAEIREWGAVEVIAHRADAPVIRGASPARPPKLSADEREPHQRITDRLAPAPPVAVDREVDGGDVLDFGGGAEVLATPGHTPGSMALHLPAHGVLITGDTAAEHLGRVLLGAFNVDGAAAAASLRRLADVPADVAVFGHGEPVRSAAQARLRDAVTALTR
jgi:glyoxylase-like metal-dependent hydrolase (beta-lactamase superfamily II)